MINKCVFTLGNNNSIKSVVKFFIIFPNVTPSRVLVENRRISILINPQFERKSIKKHAGGEQPILTDSLRRWDAEKHYNPAANRVPEGCVARLPERPGTKKSTTNQ